MTDFRRYQPRRASSPTPWRRWLVLGVVVILLVIIGQAVFGGKKSSTTSSKKNTNSSTGISLLNDNTSTTNANVASLANSNSNTNAPPAVADSWANFSVNTCSGVIGAFGAKKNVALTFDIAADNDQSKQVVQLLAQKKTPASFFSTGTFAEAHPDFLKTVSTAGYSVYNHGAKSVDLTTLSAADVAASLLSADTSISAATGSSSKPLMRPPFGSTNAATTATAKSAGYCAITWTVDAFDWKDGVTADQAKQRVLDKLQPGAIILLHAGYDITPQFLPGLLTDLAAKGYTPVSLATLLQSS